MPEVFNDKTRKKHQLMKCKSGSTNSNSLYTDDEIKQMREFYKTHTFGETYEKFNKGTGGKPGFNRALKHEYTNIPLPDKKPYMRISKPRGPYKKK